MIAKEIINLLSKNPEAEVTITVSDKKYSAINVITILNEPTIIGTPIDSRKTFEIEEPYYTINKYLPKNSKTVFYRNPNVIHFNFYVTYEKDGAHYFIEANGDKLFELNINAKYSSMKSEAITLLRNSYGITDLFENDFNFIDAFRNINNGKFITFG